MLIEFGIDTMDKGNRRTVYLVSIQLMDAEPGAKGRAHWDVVRCATNELVAHGVMDAPRADHPDLVGRVTALVLARAFPLVPENRYMEPYDTENENHGK